MPSRYITPGRARELIGAEALAVAAPDGAAGDGVDSARLEAAVEAVNGRIDAEIQIRYEIPLADGEIPRWLELAAAHLVHELLCADDAAMTDLVRERAERARADVRKAGRGEIKLKQDGAGEANAGRTRAGRAYVADGNERTFRRKDTAGVL